MISLETRQTFFSPAMLLLHFALIDLICHNSPTTPCDPVHGDALYEVTYDDWRAAGPAKAPFRIMHVSRGSSSFLSGRKATRRHQQLWKRPVRRSRSSRKKLSPTSPN